MVGTLYDLSTGTRRRRFLRALGVFGAGPVGLRRAIDAARRTVADGVPLVWTRDRFGRPERVRLVSKERYRRLSVYANLDVGALLERQPAINGVSVQWEGVDELALDVFVDRNRPSIARKIPNRIARVPTVLTERARDRVPAQVCEERVRNFFEPLPANPEVAGVDSDGKFYGGGTLGLVAWDGRASAPRPCYVTAHHVVEDEDGNTAPLLEHEGLDGDEGRTEIVGRHLAHSSFGDGGLDVAAYEATDAVEPAPLETAADEQATVSGSWDFAGLTDATDGESIAVDFAGRSTCYERGECVSTERNDLIGYQANVSPQVATDGDSGGPILDADGKLVCTFSTYCCEQAHGPVGSELLDRLDVQLYEPNPR